jgi:hypothetical protein
LIEKWVGEADDAMDAALGGLAAQLGGTNPLRDYQARVTTARTQARDLDLQRVLVELVALDSAMVGLGTPADLTSTAAFLGGPLLSLLFVLGSFWWVVSHVSVFRFCR